MTIEIAQGFIESQSIKGTTLKAPSLVNAVMLISGTCIGAGMLALLPVTGLPGLLITALCWFFMLSTGLLLLEATLWIYDRVNIFNLARRFLGPVGKMITGGSFVFLYYSLLIAYFAASIPLYMDGINLFFGIHLDHVVGYFILFVIFTAIIFLGIELVIS